MHSEEEFFAGELQPKIDTTAERKKLASRIIELVNQISDESLDVANKPLLQDELVKASKQLNALGWN